MTDAAQKAANIGIAALAALIAFDWSTVVQPETGGAIIGGLSALKLIISAIQAGGTRKT